MPRKCSECPTLLPAGAPRTRKTCSPSCRQKRSRRLSRKNREGGLRSAEVRSLTPAMKDLLEDVGHEVAKEELRPVVREAMTEDAMQALQKMVALLPGVVEQLATDITDLDPVVRQKAHSFVLKYTLGHEKALPPDDKQPPALNVNFNMPRPDGSLEVVEAPVDSDAEELRICDTCQVPKPLKEFFGEAQRCNGCVEAFQSRAAAFLDPPPATGEEDG